LEKQLPIIFTVFFAEMLNSHFQGLGIPVYYRSAFFDKAPIPINSNNSKRNVIVLLIDQQIELKILNEIDKDISL
jgi:hypothetical protein